MAQILELSAEDLAEWRDWVASRPERVRQVAERFVPWDLYRMKSTGQRVTILAYGEPEDDLRPVTLTVGISSEYNLVFDEGRVFGIDPADLEPCELPGPNERVGLIEVRYVDAPGAASALADGATLH